MSTLLRSRKGQGTTEYIVILAIAVALAVGIFWTKLRDPLRNKVQDISQDIAGIK
jgi:hypothetical protein